MELSFASFVQQVFSSPAMLVTVLLTLGVIFVNGWTDAPNAIATCIATRCINVRAAILTSAVFNFLGVLIMTHINSSVASTISNMVDFGGNTHEALIALCAALFSIVVYSVGAAHLLERVMRDFDPLLIREKLDDMHKVEHAADEKKHEVLDALVKAFITPIEREDIILLSQNIDEVTDKIEDVMLRLYYNNIQSIRPDSLELVSIVVKSCDMVKLMLKEFASFRHSKSLRDHIIAINTLEEQADQVFVTSMRELHTTCTDLVEIICWREVYFYLEKCTDACEHVADVVEQIVMKNS